MKREKRKDIIAMRTEREEIGLKEGKRVTRVFDKEGLKTSINERIL